MLIIWIKEITTIDKVDLLNKVKERDIMLVVEWFIVHSARILVFGRS